VYSAQQNGVYFINFSKLDARILGKDIIALAFKKLNECNQSMRQILYLL